MHPILFQLGPVTIYTYGVFVALAAFTSLLLFVQEAGRNGFDRDCMFDFGIAVLLSGIVGARIFYIVLNRTFYWEHPLEMFMVHHGGLAILGGIVGGLLGGFLFLRWKKISFFAVTDIVVAYVALGHAIGRLGCFFNGCCYGIVSVYGIYFPSLEATVIPTQLIESFFLVLLFIFLRHKQQKTHQQGSNFALYLMSYGILRFLIEFLRGDSPHLLFGLSLFQYICMGLFVAGFLLRFVFFKNTKHST